jgi:hypothetical protein
MHLRTSRVALSISVLKRTLLGYPDVLTESPPNWRRSILPDAPHSSTQGTSASSMAAMTCLITLGWSAALP